MDKDIVVIYKEPKEDAEYLKMKNSEELFKKKLGGEIEKIDLDDTYIICKKDRENLMPNIYIRPRGSTLVETIRGEIFYVAKDKETGNITSFKRDNIAVYGDRLNKISHDYSNQDENGHFFTEKQQQRRKEIIERMKQYNALKRAEKQARGTISKIENTEEKSLEENPKTDKEGYFVLDLGLSPDDQIPESQKKIINLSPRDENYIKAIIFLLREINKNIMNMGI